MSTARKPPSRRPGSRPAPSSTDLDAVAAELTLEPYPVTWQGREWLFTHQELLDTWEITQDVEKLTIQEQMLMLFELALGEEQWAEFRQYPLPLGLVQRLFEDYNAYCGVGPGEGWRSAGS